MKAIKLKKFFKENMRTLRAHGLGNHFSPKTRSMKQKVGKVDFIKIKDAYTL